VDAGARPVCAVFDSIVVQPVNAALRKVPWRRAQTGHPMPSAGSAELASFPFKL